MLQDNVVLRFFVIVVLCLILEHSAQAISITLKSLFTYIESLWIYILWGKGVRGFYPLSHQTPHFKYFESVIYTSLWQKTLMRNYALCLRVKEAKESLNGNTLCCSLTDFDLLQLQRQRWMQKSSIVLNIVTRQSVGPQKRKKRKNKKRKIFIHQGGIKAMVLVWKRNKKRF